LLVISQFSHIRAGDNPEWPRRERKIVNRLCLKSSDEIFVRLPRRLTDSSQGDNCSLNGMLNPQQNISARCISKKMSEAILLQLLLENLYHHPPENRKIPDIFWISRCDSEKRVSWYIWFPDFSVFSSVYQCPQCFGTLGQFLESTPGIELQLFTCPGAEYARAVLQWVIRTHTSAIGASDLRLCFVECQFWWKSWSA